MTHKDIYTKFMIEYDKANVTSSYPSLTEYEVATVLDKAYNALIAQKVTGNNFRRATLESDVKSIADLEPLVKSTLITVNRFDDTNVARGNYPTDMLYYISSYMYVKGFRANLNDEFKPMDKISRRRLPAKLVPHQIADKFVVNSANLPWIKDPICYIEGGMCYYVFDPINEPSFELISDEMKKKEDEPLTKQQSATSNDISVYSAETEDVATTVPVTTVKTYERQDLTEYIKGFSSDAGMDSRLRSNTGWVIDIIYLDPTKNYKINVCNNFSDAAYERNDNNNYPLLEGISAMTLLLVYDENHYAAKGSLTGLVKLAVDNCTDSNNQGNYDEYDMSNIITTTDVSTKGSKLYILDSVHSALDTEFPEAVSAWESSKITVTVTATDKTTTVDPDQGTTETPGTDSGDDSGNTSGDNTGSGTGSGSSDNKGDNTGSGSDNPGSSDNTGGSTVDTPTQDPSGEEPTIVPLWGNVRIVYIKKPNKFVKDLSTPETGWVSYFDWSTKDVPAAYQFECNDTVAEELISLAVTFALENVESQRLNTKLNMRGLEA